MRFSPSIEALVALPNMVAVTRGYFEQVGIDLEYQEPVPNAAVIVQQILSGDADIAMTGTTAVAATVAQGQDIISIAALCNVPLASIVLNNDVVAKLAADGVTPTSPIQDRLNALKGLSLSLNAAGSTTHSLFRATLQTYGLNPDSDVTLQGINDIGAIVAAAREGQTDGFMQGPPQTTAATGANGFATTWINFATGDVPEFASLPFTTLVSSKDFVAKNPEAVTRFLKAEWLAFADIADQSDKLQDVKDRFFTEMEQDVWDRAVTDSRIAFAGGPIPGQKNIDALNKFVLQTNPEGKELTFEQFYDTTAVEATKS